MMTNRFLLLAAWVTSIGFAGCSGTSTGNGLGTSTGNGLGTSTGNGFVSVGLTMQGSDAVTAGDELVIADAAGVNYRFTSARAGVRDIDFYLPENTECSDLALELVEPVSCDDDKIRIEGPFIVDFLSGESWPSLEGLTIPGGEYRRVDVRFDDTRSDWGILEQGDPLLDTTFLMDGVIESSQALFRISIDVNIEARYRNDTGLVLPQDTAASVLLNLDPGQWFASLPITECIENDEFDIVDDMILIQDSGSNCQEIENALKAAIRDSGSLTLSD